MGIKTYNRTKGFHNFSIGTLSDKRIGKRYNKIQFEIGSYNK